MYRSLFPLIALLAGATSAHAESLSDALRPSIMPPEDKQAPTGFSVGPVVGITGFGSEIGFRPPQSLIGGRAQFTTLLYETTVNSGSTRFNTSTQSSAVTLMGDWHFAGNGWRASAGLRLGGLDTTLRSADPLSIVLNGVSYTSSEAGSIEGKIKFPAVLPVLTVGYTHRFDNDSPWSFSVDGGALMMRSPKVTLTATGTAASDPGFQADLAAEQNELRTQLASIKFLPVLSFAVQRRF